MRKWHIVGLWWKSVICPVGQACEPARAHELQADIDRR